MRRNDQKLTIKIRNWEKWQRGSDPGKNWVKLSTRIPHDPDFFELTIEARYLFLMLLCHAGAVGPEFKLSPSAARVLFKLRRSADFLPLIDQGFIEVEGPIERVEKKEEKRQSKPAALAVVLPDRFEEWWAVYPKKVGKKPCRTKWKARKLDHIADALIADVQTRIESDDQWKRGFIPNPQTYLNQDRWEDEIQKAPNPTQDLLAGGQRWLEKQAENE